METHSVASACLLITEVTCDLPALRPEMVSGARPTCTPLLCDLDWSTRRLSGSSACDRKSGTPLLLLPWRWLLLFALPFLLLDDPPNQLATRPITPCSTQNKRHLGHICTLPPCQGPYGCSLQGCCAMQEAVVCMCSFSGHSSFSGHT